MEIKEEIKKVFDWPQGNRVYFFEHSFYYFCVYYFSDFMTRKGASFHKEWCEDLQTEKSFYLEGYRESGKTIYVIFYLIWCIVYNKKNIIMLYTNDETTSKQKLYIVANELMVNEKLIQDYGRLYSLTKNKAEMQESGLKKTSIGDFITENGVWCLAMSLGKSPRGKLGKTRPDLIVFDDIDTLASTASERMINKNYDFIKNEVFGGKASFWSKVIFLANVIRKDWVAPRLKRDMKENKNWIVKSKAIKEDWKITWDKYVETEAEAEKINKELDEKYDDPMVSNFYKVVSIESIKDEQGTAAFNRNYLNIPYTGEWIIPMSYIKYWTVENEHCDKIIMGVDPAISEKETSDRFAITVTWLIWDRYYIKKSVGLKGKEKRYENIMAVIKKLYYEYNVSYINCESVAFQRLLAKLLKQEGLACKEIHTHKDKVTRMLELEHLFSSGKVFFEPGTEDLIDEVSIFPEWGYDDMVDSMMLTLGKKQREIIVL